MRPARYFSIIQLSNSRETASETMEDKILRLIRNDGLAMDRECGIMKLPQMSRQSERSA